MKKSFKSNTQNKNKLSNQEKKFKKKSSTYHNGSVQNSVSASSNS